MGDSILEGGTLGQHQRPELNKHDGLRQITFSSHEPSQKSVSEAPWVLEPEKVYVLPKGILPEGKGIVAAPERFYRQGKEGEQTVTGREAQWDVAAPEIDAAEKQFLQGVPRGREKNNSVSDKK